MIKKLFLHPPFANIVTTIGKGQSLFPQFVFGLPYIDKYCNPNARAITVILFLCPSVYNVHAIDVFEIDRDIAKN